MEGWDLCKLELSLFPPVVGDHLRDAQMPGRGVEDVAAVWPWNVDNHWVGCVSRRRDPGESEGRRCNNCGHSWGCTGGGRLQHFRQQLGREVVEEVVPDRWCGLDDVRLVVLL
jgi:hypothetical protein